MHSRTRMDREPVNPIGEIAQIGMDAIETECKRRGMDTVGIAVVIETRPDEELAQDSIVAGRLVETSDDADVFQTTWELFAWLLPHLTIAGRAAGIGFTLLARPVGRS